MSKKNKGHKKHVLATSQSHDSVVKESEDDMVKRVTIADLRKTTILITLLFAVEFLIFYANLMGVGA